LNTIGPTIRSVRRVDCIPTSNSLTLCPAGGRERAPVFPRPAPSNWISNRLISAPTADQQIAFLTNVQRIFSEAIHRHVQVRALAGSHRHRCRDRRRFRRDARHPDASDRGEIHLLLLASRGALRIGCGRSRGGDVKAEHCEKSPDRQCSCRGTAGCMEIV
jgi:hypothetical protein